VLLKGGHSGHVESMQFSPDGRFVVTASQDRTACIWNAETGGIVVVLKGHEDRVVSASFNPAGTEVVTASADGTARRWDARTGRDLARMVCDGPLSLATFCADGRRVLTRTELVVRLWPVDILEEARQRQPRELTAEETPRFELDASR
jgi:WD40 repeat protein